LLGCTLFLDTDDSSRAHFVLRQDSGYAVKIPVATTCGAAV